MLAFVGRNAVGKSNLLKAIDWAATVATSDLRSSDHSAVGLNSDAAADFDIELEGQQYRYSIIVTLSATAERSKKRTPRPRWSLQETLLELRDNADSVTVFARTDEDIRISNVPETVKVALTAASMPTLLAVLSDDLETSRQIRSVMSFLSKVRYYPLDEPSSPVEDSWLPDDEYKRWLADYNSSGDPGDSVIKRIAHLHLSDEERFAELQTLVGENGLGILEKIVPLKHVLGASASPGGDTYHRVMFRLNGKMFQYAGLSLGTRRVLRILVTQVFDRSTVLLLEHPEDGIHRGLLRRLMAALSSASDDCQVFIASHSTVVFDTIGPANVRLVTIEDGSTRVRSLTDIELAAAKQFLDNEGSFSDFLRSIEED